MKKILLPFDTFSGDWVIVVAFGIITSFAIIFYVLTKGTVFQVGHSLHPIFFIIGLFKICPYKSQILKDRYFST